VCGPFAARGAEGEEEYPQRLAGRYRWVLAVGKQEQERQWEQERQSGAGAAWRADNSGERRCGNGMIFPMVVRMPGKGVV
jgi:hypothetical protein